MRHEQNQDTMAAARARFRVARASGNAKPGENFRAWAKRACDPSITVGKLREIVRGKGDRNEKGKSSRRS